jgi:chorismate dehydratase
VALRIGQIEYANCIPIFPALQRNFDCSDYQFIMGVPAQLNQMLFAGTLDLCPSSSIAYARHAQDVVLLPDLSISSVGPVQSVLLFSLLPLSKLDRASVGLTVESETSVALLQIIFKKYLGYKNRFVQIESADLTSALDSYPAVLVIGDTALRWTKNYPQLYCYDLGILWYKLTGLPFVFALWMVREAISVAIPGECARISAQLLAAKHLAIESLDACLIDCSGLSWFDDNSLMAYWSNISYDLTPRHVAGVRAFYRCAQQIGLLDREPEIRFLGQAKRGG